MTPDELHALSLTALARRKAEGLRLSRHHRDKAALAEAAGEIALAKTLRGLAAHIEALAALAEAERRERAATLEQRQGRHLARERSKATRQAQAEADAARVAALFARAWRAGMGRSALQAAAAALLREDQERGSARLMTLQQADNKAGARRESRALEDMQRQSVLLTLHRAGKWLQSRGTG